MCDLVGSWPFYNWSVLKCEGKETFSSIAVRIRHLQGAKKKKKEKVFFPDSLCFAPWILWLHVTQAAGMKMYLLRVELESCTEESGPCPGPFTSLCSEGGAVISRQAFPRCCFWLMGAVLEETPQGCEGCFSPRVGRESGLGAEVSQAGG